MKGAITEIAVPGVAIAAAIFCACSVARAAITQALCSVPEHCEFNSAAALKTAVCKAAKASDCWTDDGVDTGMKPEITVTLLPLLLLPLLVEEKAVTAVGASPDAAVNPPQFWKAITHIRAVKLSVVLNRWFDVLRASNPIFFYRDDTDFSGVFPVNSSLNFRVVLGSVLLWDEFHGLFFFYRFLSMRLDSDHISVELTAVSIR
jgi:hypothetical protein